MRNKLSKWLHQLFFLIKYAPECLLYISHIISDISDIVNNPNTKEFFSARYEESLKHDLNDEQLYYYYAIKCMDYNEIISDATDEVLKSQNQILISYYLKEGLFSESQKSSLKVLEGEEYWFQNYHLILYTPAMMGDLDVNIKKYLVPKRLKVKPNSVKEMRYCSFYKTNLQNGNALINDIATTTTNITDYLELRYEETAEEFDDE